MPSRIDDRERTGAEIRAVEAVTVALPLARPVRLGSLTFSEREHVVLRVTTADGRIGRAQALTRGAPVMAILTSQLAPLLIGQDSDLLATLTDSCRRETFAAGRVGIGMRAISLVDIALWDLKGQRTGLPLWRLLGGYSSRSPTTLICGYPDTQPATTIAERATDAFAEGWRVVKVARGTDDREMRGLVRRIGEAAGETGRIVVDAAWSWRDAAEAAREVQGWGELPLAWLEDPLPPENLAAYQRLHSRLGLPLGVGDEVTDRDLLNRHLELGTLDVLRVDATLVGGISGALRLIGDASARGVPVACHVYPEVHCHLAGAVADAVSVELFHQETGEPTSFICGGPTVHPGHVVAPEEPGLGFCLDDELIARHRVA